MGSVGDTYDNAMAESFFALLECELIDRRTWKSKNEARMHGGLHVDRELVQPEFRMHPNACSSCKTILTVSVRTSAILAVPIPLHTSPCRINRTLDSTNRCSQDDRQDFGSFANFRIS